MASSYSFQRIFSLFTLFITFSLASSQQAFTLSPTSPPPPPPPLQQPPFSLPLSPFTSLTPILTSLGYHDLAVASHTLSLSSKLPPLPPPTPLTIFAPSDTSLRTCTPTCSLPLLLQEHSVPGLYPLSFLRRLAFGTKIETIIPGKCLTLTSSVNSSKLFIGGVELTQPDLYANNHVIIHGLHGFLSHLSPYSCSIDKMTSLLLPHPSPSTALTRMMLADAMIRLRTSGFSILALAMRVKYAELASLQNMTIFAIDDMAIFHGGHEYIQSVRFHIIPNKLLRVADLEKFPAATVLPTLDIGETLTVTTAGGGGVLSPVRINYVKIKVPDLIYNVKVVVHGLASPFPRLRRVTAGGSGFDAQITGGGADRFSSSDDVEASSSDGSQAAESTQSTKQSAPSPVIQTSTAVDLDDIHYGL